MAAVDTEHALIRVVLVDDQTLVRSGIRGLLNITQDIRVVEEAGSGAEAVALVQACMPDVLLLDIRMPGCSGIEVLRRLGALGKQPPTVLLTTFDDDEALLQGMRLGAKGFLLKDITLDCLADAIRRVHAGATMLRPVITERVAQRVASMEATGLSIDDPERLTPRETEVLRLMAAGFNNREISDALGTSEGTVKNHVSNILSKLGVRDRVRAVLRGIGVGYL